MLKTAFIALLLSAFVARAEGFPAISYHASEIPMDGLYFLVDLNQDGIFDYYFAGYTVISTYSDGPATQIPELTTYGFNGNDYLMDATGQILLVPAGHCFGPQTLTNETWGATGSQFPLLSSGSGDSWSGFGGEPPECFLGLRFVINGRQHYGWLRLLMPTRQLSQSTNAQGTVFPVVADWAYETRPDTPIRAGEVGTNDEPVVFTVDFENPDGTLNGSDIRRSTGSFILEGDTLQYEMVLDGSHTNLDIFSVNQSTPLFSVTQAPVGLPGFPTYLFGEFELSRSQIDQFLCGRCYASVDQDSIMGWIIPAVETNRARHGMKFRLGDHPKYGAPAH